MLQAANFYKPSGKFGVSAIFLFLLLGGLGGGLLGAIYAVAIFYIPFIYINFFITLGFGFGVGLLVTTAGSLGKSRARKLDMAFGFLMGVFSLYVSWVVWIRALLGWDAELAGGWIEMLLNPVGIFMFIVEINREGVWEIFGGTPSGFLLWAIWGVEALIVVGLSAFVATTSSDNVFCERCGVWAENEELKPREFPEDMDVLMAELNGGSIAGFSGLPAGGADKGAYLQGTHAQCVLCKELHTLTVKAVVVSYDDKGEQQEQETEILSGLLVPAAEAQNLS